MVFGLARTIWFTRFNWSFGRSISLRSTASLPSDGRQPWPKAAPHVGLLPTNTIATSDSAAMLEAARLLMLSRMYRTRAAGPSLDLIPSTGVTVYGGMPAYQSENTSLPLTPMTATDLTASLFNGSRSLSFFSSTIDFWVTVRARALCWGPYQGSSTRL